MLLGLLILYTPQKKQETTRKLYEALQSHFKDEAIQNQDSVAPPHHNVAGHSLVHPDFLLNKFITSSVKTKVLLMSVC